jgi:hypothetical protein
VCNILAWVAHIKNIKTFIFVSYDINGTFKINDKIRKIKMPNSSLKKLIINNNYKNLSKG